jgi:hypothetical protein
MNMAMFMRNAALPSSKVIISAILFFISRCTEPGDRFSEVMHYFHWYFLLPGIIIIDQLKWKSRLPALKGNFLSAFCNTTQPPYNT